MITTEELARIRAAAIGDMLGDSKELDKLSPAATIFRLCRELELGELRRKDKPLKVPTALTNKAAREAAVAAWNALPRALTWTYEPPKVPGMYWNRSKNYPNEACIIRVSKYRIEQLARMRCSPNEQWAGPIPEPCEPKE